MVPRETSSKAPPSGNATAPPVTVAGIFLAFGENRVLEGISLEIQKGETVAILGESGGGKTVLLKVMIGIQAPDKGQVRLFGTDIIGLTDEQMEPMRRRMSVVFQGSAIYSGLTVEENVALELREIWKLSEKEIAVRVKEALAAVGLEEVDPALVPDELSGGMKKRLAVARAIATKPEVIFYDEPTSGLDPINSGRILELIVEMHRQTAATSVIVTHDLRGACKIANRIILLADHLVAFDGTPEAFITSKEQAVEAYRTAVSQVVSPPQAASAKAAEPARTPTEPQKPAARPSARESVPAR